MHLFENGDPMATPGWKGLSGRAWIRGNKKTNHVLDLVTRKYKYILMFNI